MNIKELHTNHNDASLQKLFTGSKGTATAMEIKSGARLMPHTSDVNALLLCVSGEVTYGEENRTVTLSPGDYTVIEPNVLHWVDAGTDSQLILLK